MDPKQCVYVIFVVQSLSCNLCRAILVARLLQATPPTSHLSEAKVWHTGQTKIENQVQKITEVNGSDLGSSTEVKPVSVVHCPEIHLMVSILSLC